MEKTFDQVCRDIDWSKMEKSRVTVKNLVKEHPSLQYLEKFLEQIADSAVDVHGMPLSSIYPRAMLQCKAHSNRN